MQKCFSSIDFSFFAGDLCDRPPLRFLKRKGGRRPPLPTAVVTAAAVAAVQLGGAEKNARQQSLRRSRGRRWHPSPEPKLCAAMTAN